MSNQIVLPHGEMFKLIHQVNLLDEVENACLAEMDYTGKEELHLCDHFPNQPVFPGAILIEAMAQTANQCAQTMPDLKDCKFYLVGVDDCRFRHIVTPPAKIHLAAHVDKRKGNVFFIRCEANLDGDIVADATLLCSLMP